MKIVAIILTSTLLGVMAWLVYDSHAKADGVRNEMELLRRQISGSQQEPAPASNLPPDLERDVREEMLRRSKAGSPLPPSTPLMAEPAPAYPSPPAPGPGSPSAAPGRGVPGQPYPAPPAYGAAGQPAPAYPPAGYPAPAGTPAGSIQAPSLDPSTVAPVALTPQQRKLAMLPRLAQVAEYSKEGGFLIFNAGASKSLEVGMKLAIRRGSSLIARIEVQEISADGAIANVPEDMIYPGATIEVGDDVIQDVPTGGN